MRLSEEMKMEFNDIKARLRSIHDGEYLDSLSRIGLPGFWVNIVMSYRKIILLKYSWDLYKYRNKGLSYTKGN